MAIIGGEITVTTRNSDFQDILHIYQLHFIDGKCIDQCKAKINQKLIKILTVGFDTKYVSQFYFSKLLFFCSTFAVLQIKLFLINLKCLNTNGSELV